MNSLWDVYIEYHCPGLRHVGCKLYYSTPNVIFLKSSHLENSHLMLVVCPINKLCPHTHTHSNVRFRSRCLIIPFQNPSVGPRDSVERKARAKLESALIQSRYSAAIGWVISLGKKLEECLEDVHLLETELQQTSMFCNTSRQCFGWALLLYFTTQVCEHLC